jgi:hypothetical protein
LEISSWNTVLAERGLQLLRTSLLRFLIRLPLLPAAFPFFPCVAALDICCICIFSFLLRRVDIQCGLERPTKSSRTAAELALVDSRFFLQPSTPAPPRNPRTRSQTGGLQRTPQRAASRLSIEVAGLCEKGKKMAERNQTNEAAELPSALPTTPSSASRRPRA